MRKNGLRRLLQPKSNGVVAGEPRFERAARLSPVACMLPLLWLLAIAAGNAVAEGNTAASQEWKLSPAQWARLAVGGLVIEDQVAAGSRRGSVRAAILIHAAREPIFAAMTDCAQALQFVPHLEHCTVLSTDAGGASQTIEHSVNMRWFLPRTHYVFRADYRPPERVSFHAVSGDMRVNEGVWLLTTVSRNGAAGAPATLLTYRVALEPRVYIPAWLVRASLRNDLPALLKALREHCER